MTKAVSKWFAIALDGDVEFFGSRGETVRFIPKTVRFWVDLVRFRIEIGRFVGEK